MNAQVWTGILLPFLGTSLGAAMVFVLKDRISDGIQRMLTGFAAGAMFYVVVEELIPEMSEGVGKYVRSNRSWRSFVKRFFGSDVYIDHFAFDDSGNGYGATFISVVRQCCDNANRAFFDEKMPDGSIVHAFAQRISTNPIQGSAAVAVAVLSISVFDAQMMRREEEKKPRQEKASLGRIAALSPN